MGVNLLILSVVVGKEHERKKSTLTNNQGLEKKQTTNACSAHPLPPNEPMQNEASFFASSFYIALC